MNISVAIISYNSEKFLHNNIRSLLEQSIPFKHIVIIDNFSSDNSRNIIESYQNSIEPILPDKNTGYAAAANTAIRHILTDREAELIMVANSDIILDNNFNKNVIEKFEKEQDIGMMSPLILRFDKKTVDSAGQMCSRTLHPVEIGFNHSLEKVDITEKPVFSVCGAATIFTRKTLDILNMEGEYYDEDFFMFWEDFDIGWRANHLNIKTIFFPKAIVYHFRSGTMKKNFFSRFSLALARPPLIKYHLIKNRYLTIIKNFRLRQHVKFLPYAILKDFIWVSLLTLSSPKIIIPLMHSGKHIKHALKKRKLLAEHIKSINTPSAGNPGTL